MKKIITIILCLILTLGLFSLSATAEETFIEGEYEPNVLLIKFHPISKFPGKEKQYNDELNKVKGWGFDYIEALDVHVVYIDDMSKNPNAALNRFKNNAFIEYVEPNHIGSFDLVPNDTNYKASGSTYAKYINAEAGWDILTSSNVPVAIVDTGYSGNKDLLPANGYSVFNKNTNITDVYGHGTKVAGTLGAIGDNKTGNTGVVWNANIIPVKVSETSSMTASNVASAITWAADNGAKIINLSLGLTSNNTTIKNAVDYAYNKGCLIVAATGNAGSTTISYPAALPNVLAVGGTSNGKVRAANSNYGTGLDVLASYTWYTTQTNGSYAATSGTSIAAPQVAGLAALIWEIAPNLSNNEVMDIIRQNTDRADGKWDAQTGYGIIDMAKALKAAASAANKPVQAATPTPTPTATPIPTATPAATATPIPTATPVATAPPKEVVKRTSYNFTGSGNPNKGPVPFSYNVVADGDGTVSLTVGGINKSSIDVSVKDSSGTEVFKQSFTANKSVDFNVAAGKYTIDAAITSGNGNCSFTLALLMPEVVYIQTADGDIPLAGYFAEDTAPANDIIILIIIAATSIILIGCTALYAIRRRRNVNTTK